MKNRNTRSTSLGHHLAFILVAGLMLASAMIAAPVFSASEKLVSGGALRGEATRSAIQRTSQAKTSLLTSVFGRWFASPVQETIVTYAGDCTTPRSTFFSGETVCAKTDNVDLNYPGGRWVDWILTGPQNTIVSGSRTTTLITTNPQTFTYAPNTTGVYKVEITQDFNGQDDPQTPAVFTVIDAPPMATYDATCTTAKTDFVLGETVCAKATGLAGFSFAWNDPDGFIVQKTAITSSPQTDSFTLPTTDTSNIGGFFIANNLGTWRVNAVTSRNSVKTGAFITVTDPANARVDLSITKTLLSDPPVQGDLVQYLVRITNNGPDNAVNTRFVDDTFTNATFSSVTQSGGPTFTCSGTGSADCTIALFPNGSVATFVVNFTAGTAGGNLDNRATVSSDTAELNSQDNSNDAPTIKVGSTGTAPTCGLTCPNNITTPANTSENGQEGAHVTFDDPSTGGTCGTVTTNPASGSFFPVGTTTVTSTSSQGNGVCSFTVEVTAPVSISCPSNKTANADSDCSATVAVGTPTTTGDNVTVTSSRSDGRPLADPFPAGVTTITWTATAHSSSPPTDDNSTGSATCTQTVTVNDVTPPVITAQSSTVAADANCQATVPDYTNQVTDNCACAASDTSQDCVGQHRISTTQSVPAGTVLGPGSYPIHLTANDGSSNNDGAGNTTEKDITLTVADQTPPTIQCPANITRSTDPGTCSATVNPGTATATDNCDTSVTISGTRSDSQPLNAPYPKGTTTITWTATDDANNSSTCAQTVTVNDTEPPTISCPSNITKNNDPGVCGAVVTYTTPVGSDNCAGATTVQTAGLPSGSTFPVGTTTNTFRVTDASGNATSCSFTVTVNDVEPPVITCPSSQVLEPTCPSGAIGNWTAPVGTDNCPGAVTTRTAGPAPGSTFAAGTTTTITYTVNDAHGNSTSCSFTITVKTLLQTLDDLRASVAANTQLNGTQRNGLLAKLDAAKQLIQNGSQNGACAKLSDFVNSTQNFINHGDLSATTGNAWISTANHIRNAFGCTNNPCS
jgi:HYR domain/Domain of unknown function DUF11